MDETLASLNGFSCTGRYAQIDRGSHPSPRHPGVRGGRAVVACPDLCGSIQSEEVRRGPLQWELEALASHHWGRYNEYEELAGSFNLRWHQFPWNAHLPTTLGHGIGLSYTTVVPEQEVLYRRGQSARLLAFLMWDVTFSLPDHPAWAVFFRIHHRSGAFGTFSGVHGAANYPCIGIMYSF